MLKQNRNLIVFLSVPAIALGIIIYWGLINGFQSESVFEGIIFWLTFGLLGSLCIKKGNGIQKALNKIFSPIGKAFDAVFDWLYWINYRGIFIIIGIIFGLWILLYLLFSYPLISIALILLIWFIIWLLSHR